MTDPTPATGRILCNAIMSLEEMWNLSAGGYGE